MRAEHNPYHEAYLSHLLLAVLLSVCLFGVDCTPTPPPASVHECSAMANITDFKGLWYGSPLRAPPGAASTALNVISTRSGAAECIPGQETLSGMYEDGDDRLRSGYSYGGYGIEHTGTALYRRTPSTGAVDFITFNQPPGGPLARMRLVVAGSDLYMPTSTGVLVMDGPTSTPGVPGAPSSFPPYDYFSQNSPGGILPVGASVAYRVLFGRNDSQGRVILGDPSGRVVVTNEGPSSPGQMNLSVLVPGYLGLVAGDFIQVYRTTIAASGIPPGDTMYLVKEHLLTSGDLSFGAVAFVDNTPDVVLGPPLYTNTTAVLGGITMGNHRPPLASDAAYYRQCLFLANTTDPHKMLLRMVAAPNVGSQFTIGGLTYTANTTSVGNGNFFTWAPLTASVSQQIQETALNLVRAINIHTSNTSLFAYYVSGESDPPGMIAIESRAATNPAFTVVGLNTSKDAFEPPLTSAYSSTQDVRLNGLSISKEGLPYAFPSNSAYHLRLGRSDARILRVIPNRDSLFIFKEDGLWRLWGSPGAWVTQQMSVDTILLFPDSVAVLDNQVFAFTNKNIVAIDESGIEIVTDDATKTAFQAIQDGMLAASGGLSPASLFAVADGTSLRYTLFHATGASTGTTADHAFIYNGVTDLWTERDDMATGGYIGPDGLLYLGSASSAEVTRQRNTGTASDYKGPSGGPIPVEIEWLRLNSPDGTSQYTELRLLTEENTSGDYLFTFTSHYNESSTSMAEAENLPEVRVWVPDDVQRTTRLRVNVKRDVQEEHLVVLGIADMLNAYNGPPTRR